MIGFFYISSFDDTDIKVSSDNFLCTKMYQNLVWDFLALTKNKEVKND